MTTATRRSLIKAGSTAAGALALPALTAGVAKAAASSSSSSTKTASSISVASGDTLVITTTTRTGKLVIASGGALAAPSGYSLTLTVNGVDTGEKLTATGGTTTAIAAGTYTGDVVLTVTTANDVTFGDYTFPLRQAVYVGGSGVVSASSVLAAVQGGKLTTSLAKNVSIRSTGECFNAVYVTDGTYALTNPDIRLDGNGRCDFIGYGAAIVGTGSSATLVVDGATINNAGAVRTAVVSNDGANVLVKNSHITCVDGTLPSDYVASVTTDLMESAPWMLGLGGNVRTTIALGSAATATYVNSRLSSEQWGVLSTDSGSDCVLTAINCTVTNTGDTGYGSYAIGSATERFLGSTFNVGSYATVNRGGAVYYGDSTRSVVKALNTSASLGLTAADLASIPERNCVINSRRFGFMWHGAGTLDISGGTVVNTKMATFLNKGQEVGITVDGSGGAKLKPANGIIMQVITNDDPGPVMVDGVLENTGTYTEPTATITKDSSFDVTTASSTDSVATFTDIKLTGDFYNGIREGLNMVLTFDDSTVEGVITASTAKHDVSTIDSSNYTEMGIVTNTPSAVVNNGVIVTLGSGSAWKVTGTCYLSKLVIASDAKITAPTGKTVTMTVAGTTTAITAGSTYSSADGITLTVS